MKAKIVLFLSLMAVLSLTFVSCKSAKQRKYEELVKKYPGFMICYETKETIKLANKKGYQALTAENFKKLLLDDTTHYKFVIIYSPCCGATVEHMVRTYPKVLKRVGKENVKWYYILDDSGGIMYDEDLRKKYGIDNFEKYYLHDSKFSEEGNITSLTDIANYIFDKDEVKITDILGTPTNFIVSKDGKLLKCLFAYDDIEAIHPTELYSIFDKDLEELDFNKIDTIRIPFAKHEVLQGME